VIAFEHASTVTDARRQRAVYTHAYVPDTNVEINHKALDAKGSRWGGFVLRPTGTGPYGPSQSVAAKTKTIHVGIFNWWNEPFPSML